MAPWTIGRETPDQPDVAALLSAADARSGSLYPGERRFGPDVPALLSAQVRFFVARCDGRALGCGGYVLLDGAAAELKRLFVDGAVRGKGIGTALVRAVGDAARREGVRTLCLETGVKSAEALSLYRRFGFLECPPFEPYRPDPLSVFMAKRLP